jgi:hypothetical protein
MKYDFNMEEKVGNTKGIGDIAIAEDGNAWATIAKEVEGLISNKDVHKSIEDIKESIESMKCKTDPIFAKIENNRLNIKRICVFVILALIVSVLAICVSLNAFSLDSMAFLGWTTAMLSMLVVVLMGWQIFNIVELKELKNNFNDIVVDRTTPLEIKARNHEKSINEMESNLKYMVNLHEKIENNKSSDTKMIDYKIQLHCSTLNGLIDYNSGNYKASLNNCMNALSYLNLLNGISYYSFSSPAYYIKRLSAEYIMGTMRLSDDERRAYVKILSAYKGVDRDELIEFVEKIPSINND